MAEILPMIDKVQTEALKKSFARIHELATELNALMPPGMSVEVKIPEQQTVIVPNQKKKTHTIIISKPVMLLTLEPQ